MPLYHHIASTGMVCQCLIVTLLLIKHLWGLMNFPPAVNQWSRVWSSQQSQDNFGHPGRGGGPKCGCSILQRLKGAVEASTKQESTLQNPLSQLVGGDWSQQAVQNELPSPPAMLLQSSHLPPALSLALGP